MFANPTRIPQFRTRSLTGMAWAGVVHASRVHVGADTRPVRPGLACRRAAGAGGRLDCYWSNEFDDGTSLEAQRQLAEVSDCCPLTSNNLITGRLRRRWMNWRHENGRGT
jgi:hypothetical protein